METALFALLLIACIFGAIELVRWLTNWFACRRLLPKEWILLPIRGEMEDVEYVIRSLLWKSAWGESGNGMTCSPHILIVDMGMSEETRAVCEKMAEDFSSLEICLPGELIARLEK